MKGISKLRSKHYPLVIESKVPVRFYWADDGHSNLDYDGFEFGSLEGCSKYQVQLLDSVIHELWYQMHCARVFEYMSKHHRAELEIIIDHMHAEDLGVPQSFINAFRNKEDEWN